MTLAERTDARALPDRASLLSRNLVCSQPPWGWFSIVIAGLGLTAGVGAELGPIAAGYVLIMATAGPILARFAGHRPSG